MSSEDDDIPEIDLDLIVKPYQFEPLVRNENAATATAQLGDSDIDIESNSSGSEETDDQNSVNDVRVVSKATFDVNTDRIGNTKWCQCTFCIPLRKGKECKCCHEMPKVLQIMDENMNCITESTAFRNVCLDPDVIRTAMHTFLETQGPIDDEPLNDTYGYVAYRQWTFWVHHKLGRRIRKPLPACAVGKIREAFPSDDGKYKGFEYAK